MDDKGSMVNPGFYARYGKRALDLALGTLTLVGLLPLLAVIAALIHLETTGPILFRQERLGWRGRIFHAYKFRTMTHRERIPDREILPGDPEVTRLGYWLRRFKLDEWPQLLNILAGDMSIVGPRPALPRQLAEYDAYGRKRLEVRPGLTGLAQIHGSIYLTWPERWKYDARYVDELSFRLDAWIIMRTIPVMILGESRFLKLPPKDT